MKLRLPPVPMELLKQIHETHLYGMTVEETAERLLLEKIREFIRPDSLLLELPKIRKAARKK